MLDTGALARFAREVAAAFEHLAERMEQGANQPVSIVSPRKLVDVLPGSRQRAVYEVLLGAGESGLTTGEINNRISYDFSNTYTTMQRLRQLGIVDLVPGTRYQTWRLTEPYRDEPAG